VKPQRWPINGNPGPSLNPPTDWNLYTCAECRRRIYSDEVSRAVVSERDGVERPICIPCDERGAA
jgi:hypothetical protein